MKSATFSTLILALGLVSGLRAHAGTISLPQKALRIEAQMQALLSKPDAKPEFDKKVHEWDDVTLQLKRDPQILQAEIDRVRNRMDRNIGQTKNQKAFEKDLELWTQLQALQKRLGLEPTATVTAESAPAPKPFRRPPEPTAPVTDQPTLHLWSHGPAYGYFKNHNLLVLVTKAWETEAEVQYRIEGQDHTGLVHFTNPEVIWLYADRTAAIRYDADIESRGRPVGVYARSKDGAFAVTQAFDSDESPTFTSKSQLTPLRFSEGRVRWYEPGSIPFWGTTHEGIVQYSTTDDSAVVVLVQNEDGSRSTKLVYPEFDEKFQWLERPPRTCIVGYGG